MRHHPHRGVDRVSEPVYTRAELLDEAGNGARLLAVTRLLLGIDRKRRDVATSVAANAKSDSDEVLKPRR